MTEGVGLGKTCWESNKFKVGFLECPIFWIILYKKISIFNLFLSAAFYFKHLNNIVWRQTITFRMKVPALQSGIGFPCSSCLLL